MNANATKAISTASLILVVVVISSASDDNVLTFRAQFGSKLLWYGVTDAVIDSTPAWSDLDNSPPLSAKRAIEVAKKAVVRFEEEGRVKSLPDILEWKINKLTLKPLDNEKWLWLVSFEASPKPGAGMMGISPEISVVVTMDGHVLSPSVREPT